MSTLLELDRLSVSLPRGADRALALDGVTLALAKTEILCVVGESGSGKSMAANAIMGLLPPGVAVAGGAIRFRGRDLTALTQNELRGIRGTGIAMIFQEPMTALNPLKTVGDQIAEMFRTHTELGRAEIEGRVVALLEEVQIPGPRTAMRAFPHELSGGQRQRAMIAMALALEPPVLIADEPTTALDVTTQARILQLIKELQARKGTAVLFITHDFGVVAEIADRVAVMQNGIVVEEGSVEQVLKAPSHPYTQSLIAAVPSLRPPPPRAIASTTILEARHLFKTFRTGRLLARTRRVTPALNDLSFVLPRGATLGVVGESGSGKTTLARCIVRLVEPDAGSIFVGDVDLAQLTKAQLRRRTRHVQMVFQDPFGSLNPRRRVGELVAQGPIAHGMPRAEALRRAKNLFAMVGLDPAATDRYPHEFSAGSASASALRGRSRSSPTSWSPTSQCLLSTSRSRPRSSPCSPACGSGSACP
jgi:peptide/nickel transport system ATP-binding protein